METGKEGRKYFSDRDREPISFKFKLIHEMFAADINRQLKDDDLTFSQLLVLSYLQHNTESKVTQKDLSQALHIKHPTTIGLLKRLEEKGMLEVVVDSDNRKYRNIILTQKGNALMEANKRRRTFLDTALVKGMTDEEKKELRRLLDKVYDNMNEVV